MGRYTTGVVAAVKNALRVIISCISPLDWRMSFKGADRLVDDVTKNQLSVFFLAKRNKPCGFEVINVSIVEFTSEEKAAITQKLQRYLADELQLEIGGFDAEFLLDFFSKEVGCFFYNRGLYDAQAVLDARFEDITDAIVALEKFEEQH